jgi:hypothetical protein
MYVLRKKKLSNEAALCNTDPQMKNYPAFPGEK